MSAPHAAAKCDRCAWHLHFLRKPGRWVAFCPNPSCAVFEVGP